MREEDEDELDINNAKHDVFAIMAVIFLGLFVAIIPFMNPKPTEQIKRQTAPPAGKITVSVTWCPDTKNRECNIDVDSWTQYKGSEEHGFEPEPPVGYSNLGGVTYNLQRDDLGHVYNDPKDPTRNTDEVNFEITSSRGLPPGQHCVNLHLYNLKSGKLPVEARALVELHRVKPGMRDGKFEPPVILIEKTVQLLRNGHEKNVGCFFLDERGEPVPEKTFQSDSICLRSPHNLQSGECQDNPGGSQTPGMGG
mgnify:CR=1 FL=1